ncbi:hypothetical protein BTJ68_06659 [Hortaea werneckii EXF-2000]|uniref:Uncharacterized protein n=1 Tax=Hortaea werneckii EXF-2000 TaxID=1157616 RepID=A0A1Z5TF08_HORWE|nr:hypothetical protein BTJ68_06659 [Hortaea werneckii EXF-2000]
MAFRMVYQIPFSRCPNQPIQPNNHVSSRLHLRLPRPRPRSTDYKQHHHNSPHHRHQPNLHHHPSLHAQQHHHHPVINPCSILIENTPWLLTDITHFTPSLPSQNHTNSTTSSSSYSSSTNSSSSSPSSSIPSGFISFHFHDTNKGLGLETRCFRTFPPRDRHGSSEVDDKPGGGTYFPCEDGRVRFAYTAAAEGAAGEGEGELKVGRVHRDDCLWQANASAGEYDDHHDIVDEYDDGPRRLVLVGKVGDEDHGCDVR